MRRERVPQRMGIELRQMRQPSQNTHVPHLADRANIIGVILAHERYAMNGDATRSHSGNREQGMIDRP